MSPDNIGSAVNRFSGWPSNDPLKTDNESMTSPVAVQVIKMIAAILDPYRIVVGIDTLYTTQRETFTSESQQLIESALQTLHVINLNNLETNFHIFPDESATLVLYFSNNDIECFVFERDIPSQYRFFKMFTNLALVIDQLTDANQIL
ncbi:hypothetical protein RTG72_002154 [Escherichia coli]|nr:hypothetical protein [Escherichia coli]